MQTTRGEAIHAIASALRNQTSLDDCIVKEHKPMDYLFLATVALDAGLSGGTVRLREQHGDSGVVENDEFVEQVAKRLYSRAVFCGKDEDVNWLWTGMCAHDTRQQFRAAAREILGIEP